VRLLQHGQYFGKRAIAVISSVYFGNQIWVSAGTDWFRRWKKSIAGAWFKILSSGRIIQGTVKQFLTGKNYD